MPHSYEEIFKELMRMENEDIQTIEIDENGCFRYLFNSPTIQDFIDPEQNNKYAIDKGCDLYRIPQIGDLVLTVQVLGRFKQAILYQYDWTGSRQVIYERLCSEGIMDPFPTSGIPLLQCGKAVYLEVYESQDIEVKVTSAFLETTSRRKLAEYVFPNTEHGVKVQHANGDIYQVVNVFDHGHSPNYLALVSKAPHPNDRISNSYE